MTIDFSNVESKDFSPLPNGTYTVVATKVEDKTANTGSTGLHVTFTVAEGPRSGAKIWDDLWLYDTNGNPSKALFRIKQLLTSNGAIDNDFAGGLEEDELADMIVGREVGVEVEQRRYTKGDGSPGVAIDVKRYVQPTESPF